VTEYQWHPNHKTNGPYYVAHFTYSCSGKKRTSKCILREPLYKTGDCVPLLIYKSNPYVVKLNGSYVTVKHSPIEFYCGYVLLIVMLIGFIAFVRSFPGKRKKGKRKKRKKRKSERGII